MVGFGTESALLSKTEVVIVGALSGFTTRAICQPLDVLKIRLQLQVEPISKHIPNAKYKSLMHAVRLIHNEEGITAFWKGHVPAQFLSITYGIVQFSSFEMLTKYWHYRIGNGHRSMANFICGAISGGTATLVSFPFDVARTRLVAQAADVHGRALYKGVADALLLTWAREGTTALFRGLTPTVLQVAPHTGVQFTVFKLLNDVSVQPVVPSFVSQIGWSMFSGGVAGLVAKVVIYPLDLMRKRLQVQGIQEYRTVYGKTFICDGVLDCARQVIRKEGVAGLFKGLNAGALKAVAASALHFTTYDMFCKLFLDYG